MSKKIKVGIIGFGNMGSSCAFALRDETQYKVFIYDKDKNRTQKAKGLCVLNSAAQLIAAAEIIILAVKPQDVDTFLNRNKQHLLKKKPLMVSVAAGVPLSWLRTQLKGLQIVRVMPNLAARVRKSISFIAKGQNIKKSNLEAVKKIFAYVGKVIVVSERYLDKATGASGSGPGYIFYFMNSMYQGALNLGFTKAQAKTMVVQTFLGSVELAENSKKEFGALIKEVASRKGTTEAALEIFKAKKVDKAIIKGMGAASSRAEEISRKFIGKKGK